jgi:hypothetical protein
MTTYVRSVARDSTALSHLSDGTEAHSRFAGSVCGSREET